MSALCLCRVRGQLVQGFEGAEVVLDLVDHLLDVGVGSAPYLRVQRHGRVARALGAVSRRR